MANQISPWYKALVVFGVFASFFLQYGAVYGVGIYYVLIAKHYCASATEVSMLCSIFTAIFFAIGPISSVLTNKFGCRLVHMVAGVIAAAGFAISSLVDDIAYLYFSFAVVAGIGLGLCGAPSVVIVTHYFKEKRPLAYGIGLSGVGLGAFAFPQIVSWLLHHYDLRGAMLLTGGMCLHLTLCGAIFREVGESQDTRITEKKSPAKDKGTHIKDLLQLDLFKNFNFLALSLNCILAGLGQSVAFVHIGAYAVSIGLSTDESANVISITGIFNCAGRLIFGILPLIPCLGKYCPYMTGLITSGLIISMLAHAQTYDAVCIVCGAFGFLFAAFGALEPQVALEIVGERHLASAFGFLQVFVATGSLLGAPLAGVLYDWMSSYELSFYLAGCACVGAGLLVFIPWWRTACCCRTYHQDTDWPLYEEEFKVKLNDPDLPLYDEAIKAIEVEVL